MKKLLLSFVAAILFSLITMSNPYYFPAVFFSELYWEDDEWTIELVVSHGYFESGNQIKMVCSSGESMLLEDIYFPYNEIILITSDSLQEPLTLNREGDFVQFLFQEYSGNWVSDFGKHRFGSFPGAEVSALDPGQSLVQYYNLDYNQQYLTKTNIQTPGEYPNDVTSYGALEGYVFDEEGYPVDNAVIEEFRFLMYTFNITTDANGAFSVGDIMPKNYYTVTHKDDCIVHDTLMITVEPDSTSYIEIISDTCIFFQGVEEIEISKNQIELQVYPNPFQSNLKINLKAIHPVSLNNASLKIYDQQGREIYVRKINSPYLTDLSLEAEMKELNKGVYLLTVENDGEVLASQMIMRD